MAQSSGRARIRRIRGAGTATRFDDPEYGYVFPLLWGSDRFNNGAGMHRVLLAVRFIKAKMPLGQADLTRAGIRRRRLHQLEAAAADGQPGTRLSQPVNEADRRAVRTIRRRASDRAAPR
jgi:hypothetical protein